MPAADLIGLVRLEAVERKLVLLGIDRDGGDAEFGRGAEHADRDFRAVGDQQAADTSSHRSPNVALHNIGNGPKIKALAWSWRPLCGGLLHRNVRAAQTAKSPQSFATG